LTLTAGLLGGCGAQSGSWNPVDWWHGLEGGKIAETRPPPPNADAPYPNLGTVPKKPPPPDAAAHQKIAGALVADRRNAQYEQSISPIPPAHRPVGTPAATIAQGAKPADAEQPNASLAAAKAPPPKPAALQKAPVAPVSAAPLEAPAPPAAPAAAAPAPAAAATPDAAAAADAAMPAVPEAPPPPPQLAGIATPPAVPAPTPPPVAPPPAPPAPAKINGQPIAIPFAPGSAVLPPEALVPIKALARQRGAASIAVTGFGGATSSEPSAQTAALPLALDRARAVAALLLASGVPASAIRIAAEPQGSGAAARLVN
jgi:outer membrane protein OmpA-like peptidoglycan-associated protein